MRVLLLVSSAALTLGEPSAVHARRADDPDDEVYWDVDGDCVQPNSFVHSANAAALPAAACRSNCPSLALMVRRLPARSHF